MTHYTWWILNESTVLPVVEPDDESTMTRDEARKAAADFLLTEAKGCTEEVDAEMLDNCAQELNYADVVSVGGPFEWSVVVLPVEEPHSAGCDCEVHYQSN